MDLIELWLGIQSYFPGSIIFSILEVCGLSKYKYNLHINTIWFLWGQNGESGICVLAFKAAWLKIAGQKAIENIWNTLTWLNVKNTLPDGLAWKRCSRRDRFWNGRD
jgi:hypothetical protein